MPIVIRAFKTACNESFLLTLFSPFFLYFKKRIIIMSVPGKIHSDHRVLLNRSNSFDSLVAFNDIGKPAKDLLTKDYPVGGVKLEVKTTAPNGCCK